MITVEGDEGFQYHFAGRVETSRHSIGDPVLGGLGWTIAGKDDDD